MEDDGDGGFDFSGFSVEQVRLVAGVADGVDGGGAEHGWAAGGLKAYYVAGFVDGGGEGDGSFLLGGDAGVDRSDGDEEHAGGDCGGEADFWGVALTVGAVPEPMRSLMPEKA
jgi:hypothetical protein